MKRSLVMVLAMLFACAGAVLAQEDEGALEMPAVEQIEEAAPEAVEAATEAVEAAEGDMQDVESSLIKEVGYDPLTKVLTVVFVQAEEKYLYKNVPEDIYNALMAAESKGKYFVENIKGKFEFSKE